MPALSGLRPRLLVVPLVVALVLTAPAPVVAAPARPVADDEAVDLLHRAMSAAKRSAYQGVQRVQAWAGGRKSVQTLRVRNVPGRGTYVGSVDGAGTVTSVAQPDGRTSPPQLRLLTAKYRVVRAGAAKVAGRLADIVDARRRSGELMARYWLDRTTGLMLRRDVFGSDGRLARKSTFVRVEFGKHVDEGRATRTRSVPVGQSTPLRNVPELRADGWTVPKELGGELTLYDVRKNDRGARTSLHLSYSDGISVLSVFEQRGHLDESRLDRWHQAQVGGRTVYVRDTVPRQLMWAGPETVFTVVTDAPDQAVASTVRKLPAAEERPGFWTRMARGFERIVSWCNPF